MSYPVTASLQFDFRQGPANLDNAGNLAGLGLSDRLSALIPDGSALWHRVFLPENAEFEFTGSSGVNDAFQFGGFPTFSNEASGSPVPLLDMQGIPVNFAKLSMVAMEIKPIQPFEPAFATAKLQSDNVNPASSSTVTIGSKVYTILTALTPLEGEVLRGASADDTLLNLIRAINHTGTPGTDYQCAAANSDVSAAASVTAHTFEITARVGGQEPNSIALAVGSVNLEWSSPTLEGGLEIAVPQVAKPFGGSVTVALTGNLLPAGTEPGIASFSVEDSKIFAFGGKPWFPDAGAGFNIRFEPAGMNACVTLVLIGENTGEGPFSPLSLSPSRWLANTGSDPGVWEDISGNGRHLIQATSGARPAIVPYAINGRQVRRFDGLDDWLASTNATYAAACTLFVVHRPSALSAAYATLVDAYQDVATAGPANPAGFAALVKSSGKSAAFFVTDASYDGYDGTGAATMTTGNVYLTTMQWSAAELLTRINGTVDKSLTPSAGPSTLTAARYFAVGNSQLFSPRFYAGDIAEILMFDALLTGPEIDQIEDFFSSKYAIPIP